jgi:hypothetical protein
MKMTVDPGIFTGIAIWRNGSIYPFTTELRAVGNKNTILNTRLMPLRDNFIPLLTKYKVDECFVEDAEYWEGSFRSRTSASRGNLMLLSNIIGIYIDCCLSCNTKVYKLKPKEWKGQMKDEVVARRVLMANGMQYKSVHITQAVGMGLSIQGKL